MSLTRDGAIGGPAREYDRGPTASLAPDAVFDALENDERRTVLRLLATAEQPVEVDRLARGVATLSDRADDPAVGRAVELSEPGEPGERTADAVRTVHLPTLAGLGIVRYDSERDAAWTTADVTWLVTLLRETERFDGR